MTVVNNVTTQTELPNHPFLSDSQSTEKVNLLNFTRQELREFFKSLGEKPFRADQVMKWIYHFG